MNNTIAIDYDRTYSHHSDLLNRFIEDSLAFGYKVIVCTCRSESHKDSLLRFLETICPVYYTEHKAKYHYLQSQGVKVDMWIDDCPEYIFIDQRPV
jgi:hypothetical protein